MIRVFIVAASPLARAGLEDLLAARGAEIVGAAANFETLGDEITDSAADVLLVDSSGDASLLDTLIDSGLASDFSAVVLVNDLSTVAYTQAFRARIRALLPGDISPDQLMAALQAASAGLLVLDPFALPAHLRAGARDGIAASFAQGREALVEPLTPRESEVLQMLAAGLGNKEIASRLNISDHTVKFHVASILGKFGVSSRTEAVSFAIRRGLVLL